MYYYKTLTITEAATGIEVFRCTTKLDIYNDEEQYLTELTGWDEYSGKEIKTVPKLLGPGSYVESVHLNEREISISVSLYDTNENELTAKKDILAHTLINDTELKVIVDYFEVTADRLVETLTRTEWFEECFLSNQPGWDRTGTEALLTITILALNPYKKYSELTNGMWSSGEII